MKRHDLLRLALLAVQIARTQLRDYASKLAPKRYTQPSLLASAQALRAALGLHAVPDHSTLWWFSRHKVKPHWLARVLTEPVRWFQPAIPPRSRTVAVDATGFARVPASPTYQQRAGKRHRARTWLK